MPHSIRVVVVVAGGTCDTWLVFMQRLLTPHCAACLEFHTPCPSVAFGAFGAHGGAPSVRVARGLQLVLMVGY